MGLCISAWPLLAPWGHALRPPFSPVTTPSLFATLLRLREPCDGCAAPYGYKNHMSLTDDTDGFEVSVRRC